MNANLLIIMTSFLLIILSCSESKEDKVPEREKAKTELQNTKKSKNLSEQESFLKTSKDFLAATGIDNKELNKFLKEGEQMEALFKDSASVVDLFERMMKEGIEKKEIEKHLGRAARKQNSDNMDGFLDAFNKLNEESGVAATIAKLKKVDSLTGKNSFGSFEADPEMLETMSENVTTESGKMTKEERKMITEFNKTKNNLHSLEEIEKFKEMMQNADLDKLVDQGKVTKAYADTQKKEFKSSGTTLKDRQKRADKAKRDFRKLNPDLYFGEEAGMTYFGTRATAVYLPLGKISFADEVIDYYHPENKNDTKEVLGEPNGYQVRPQKLANVHSLGLKGSITIKFENNALMDVNGPDLYVFEKGAIEPTSLEISKDGENWIMVGKIEGGVAQVDIHDYVKPNELFYYVRLIDLETSSGIPGADVDAIAAIGAAMRLNLDSKVLFDTGKSTLKPEGLKAIKELAKSIAVLKSGNVIIEGHTDDVGGTENNQKLSLARAKSVSSALKDIISGNTFKWKEKGYGESKPLVQNDSESNRAKNRRVEILILPY